MIEANSASSSANEVSIRTWVFGCFGPDLAGGLDAAAVCQPDVHHDDVGAGAVGLVDRVLDRAGLARSRRCRPAASSIARMPSRTISWSSTSMTRSGGFLVIARHPSGAPGPGDAQTSVVRVVGRRRLRQHGLADAVQEVLQGGLGDTEQQGSVDRAPDRAQRGHVPGADGQLGPPRAEGRHLEVGIQ